MSVNQKKMILYSVATLLVGGVVYVVDNQLGSPIFTNLFGRFLKKKEEPKEQPKTEETSGSSEAA